MRKQTCIVCVLVLLLTMISIPAALAAETDYTGDWVCKYVDFGDGELQTDYEGMSIQDNLYFNLQADGSALLTSFGEQQAGTWALSDTGLTVTVDDIPVAFVWQDGLLVNDEDGFIMYFGRPEPVPTVSIDTAAFIGDWVCKYLDIGEMKQMTEYEGASLQDSIYFTLSEDGTYSLTSFGENLTGTWQTNADGLSLLVNGVTVPFVYQDPQLINDDNSGMIMYFEKAEAKPKTGGFSRFGEYRQTCIRTFCVCRQLDRRIL